MYQALLVIIFWVGLSCHPSQAQRPNILWLTCEDISPTLSMYGDSTAQTPHLDRLAAESLMYTQAFTTVGVCAPSRSSLITGMYPVSIGTHHMRTGLDIQGWGKREYDGASMARDINGEAIPHYAAVPPPEVRCFPTYLRAEGYFCTNRVKTDYQFAAPVTAWDENGPQAHWRHRREGQPFFSVFNFTVTHESMLWKNQALPLTVAPAAVPLPAYFPDTETVRRDVARHYSNVELLDQAIGACLAELEADGLLDETIIFFFSDHGGPLPRGKRAHYPSGLQVPLMVRIPTQLGRQYVHDLISFVDLAPTVLSLAGVDPPAHMQGQVFLGPNQSASKRAYIFGSGDRFDEHADQVRSVISPDYVFVQNAYPDRPAYKDIGYRRHIPMMNELVALHAAGRLTPAQNYWFRQFKTEEEFYLRRSDPHCLRNLIDDPRYQTEISAMRQALGEWQREIGDYADLPEKAMLARMWPDGKQPQTARPVAETKGKRIQLSCSTPGASIAYLIADEELTPGLDAGWQVYTQPLALQPGERLYAMGVRLGYQDSEILVMP